LVRAVVVSFNERGGQCVGLASGGGASAQKKKKTKNTVQKLVLYT
jgi:hypothetical protein